ncbi:16616_t:CDS:1, partial [Racocetra persica]
MDEKTSLIFNMNRNTQTAYHNDNGVVVNVYIMTMDDHLVAVNASSVVSLLHRSDSPVQA